MKSFVWDSVDDLKNSMGTFVNMKSKNHRTIEWPGLERTTVIISFQPPAMCRVAHQETRLPRATSSLALNACRDGASTTSYIIRRVMLYK